MSEESDDSMIDFMKELKEEPKKAISLWEVLFSDNNICYKCGTTDDLLFVAMCNVSICKSCLSLIVKRSVAQVRKSKTIKPVVET